MERRGSDDDDNPLSMTQRRFHDLLDAYGADPARWPVEERASALALVAISAEAHAVQEEAAQLDQLLDLSPRVVSSTVLAERVLARLPQPEASECVPERRPVLRLLHSGRRARRQGVGRSVAARFSHTTRVWSSLAAALLVIVGVWSLRQQGLTQPTPTFDPATLGVYETPTDVLLEAPGFDLYSAMPTIGCEDSELACPQFDTPQDIQSQSSIEGRKLV